MGSVTRRVSREMHGKARQMAEIVAAKDLDKAIDAILGEWFRKPAPPVLYHYTSSKAVQSILGSREIWLTDRLHAQGDTKEIVHADEMIAEAIVDAREGGSALWSAVCERAEGRLGRDKLANAFDVFIGCFTPERDSAQHWSDFGEVSFAIGFNTLSEEVTIPHVGLGLFEVQYDSAVLRRQLDVTHARLRQLALETRASYHRAMDLLVPGMLRVSGAASAAYKPEAFAQQKEWRLVGIGRVTPGGGTGYHTFKRAGKRRVKMPLRPHRARPEVHEILAGPACLPQLINEMRAFLDANGYVDVPVRRSCAEPAPRSAPRRNHT